MNTANTIREQLGGARFAMMTGAHNFVGDTNSLTFKIGRFAGLKITHVTITLEANDLYTVKFFNVRGTKVTTIAERELVPAENLAAVFSAITGLDTNL